MKSLMLLVTPIIVALVTGTTAYNLFTQAATTLALANHFIR